MPQLPIANGFYQSNSLIISNQNCVGWYPNIVQTQGLSQETLFGTPGLVQQLTTGGVDFISRGLHTKEGILFGVNGDELIRVDENFDGLGNQFFTKTVLGEITGTDKMASRRVSRIELLLSNTHRASSAVIPERGVALPTISIPSIMPAPQYQLKPF